MFHPYSDVPDVALKENTLTNSFQNHYSKGGNGEGGGGVSLQAQNFGIYPFCWILAINYSISPGRKGEDPIQQQKIYNFPHQKNPPQ